MNKNIRIFVFILATIAGLLLGLKYLVFDKIVPPLGVVFVSPENQQTSVSVNSAIKIDFNMTLVTPDDILVNFSPAIDGVRSFDNDQKTMIITPQGPLHSGTDYAITITDQKNNRLWQSTFATEKMQGDPAVIYESEKYTQDNYPLLKYTPWIEKNFWVSYTEPLTLAVRVQKGTRQMIEPLVLNWITTHGVKPETHRIEWTLSNVTPVPESPAFQNGD